jgi:hypothetical protein
MYMGLKTYETRDERFILPGVKRYRGPLAIHAAKKTFDPLDYDPRLCSQLAKDGLKTPENLVYGAVLCVLDLVDIVPTAQVRGSLDARELMYGDYSTGRCALQTTNLRQLEIPELVKGHQGLFYWDVPSRLTQKLALTPCEGCSKNAGMLWNMQGLVNVAIRLCNGCYQLAKSSYPNTPFQYVRQGDAA